MREMSANASGRCGWVKFRGVVDIGGAAGGNSARVIARAIKYGGAKLTRSTGSSDGESVKNAANDALTNIGRQRNCESLCGSDTRSWTGREDAVDLRCLSRSV